LENAVSREGLDEAVGRIRHQLRALGELRCIRVRSASSVMEELQHLDKLLTCASLGVSQLQDRSLREEIERLRHHRDTRDTTREKAQRSTAAVAVGARDAGREQVGEPCLHVQRFDRFAMARALELPSSADDHTSQSGVGCVIARAGQNNRRRLA